MALGSEMDDAIHLVVLHQLQHQVEITDITLNESIVRRMASTENQALAVEYLTLWVVAQIVSHSIESTLVVDVLQKIDQSEAKDLALTLEMYVFGTVDLFAHPTNVDMQNRFIVFDVRDLGANLKKAGMLIALDYIQNQLIANKEAGINTWLYADEFHLFYSDNEDENSAGIFFERVFARCRKSECPQGAPHRLS